MTDMDDAAADLERQISLAYHNGWKDGAKQFSGMNAPYDRMRASAHVQACQERVTQVASELGVWLTVYEQLMIRSGLSRETVEQSLEVKREQIDSLRKVARELREADREANDRGCVEDEPFCVVSCSRTCYYA